MISELQVLWAEESKPLANMLKLDPIVNGSDGTGANFILGETLMLYVGKSGSKVNAIYYLFQDGNPEPIKRLFETEGSSIDSTASKLISEIVQNWIHYSNASFHFMKNSYAHNL